MALVEPTPAAIRRAGELARSGAIVAFPTDTVYGIGTAAADGTAVGRLYVVKGRPEDRPIPVLLPSLDLLERVVREVPEGARRLAERYWPGPLTLVLPARPLPREVTAGGATVGVRVPDHPVALGVLRAAGVPLAVTSANRSGAANLTTGEQVESELGRSLTLVLNGTAPGGVPSTVLDLSGDEPVVLRHGALSAAEIEAVLGTHVR